MTVLHSRLLDVLILLLVGSSTTSSVNAFNLPRPTNAVRRGIQRSQNDNDSCASRSRDKRAIRRTSLFVINNQGTATTATAKEQEKVLREELKEKNSVVPDEERFGLAEAEGMEGAFLDAAVADSSSSTTTTARNNKSLKSRMERMVKPRSYPLFLAEKAAEVVEASVRDMAKLTAQYDGSTTSPYYYTSSSSSSTGRKTVMANEMLEKEKIVILGTGWGAASFLKEIDTDLYDVTVISPRNYFLFTPMLAGASVGTVEYRSITEPIREINRKTNFLEGIATSVDPVQSTVTCETVVCEGNSCDIDTFTIPYDRLIVTIGAQTNTFGIPGVREHCCFLKQVEDARRIRTAIVNCFERANLPSLTDQEREENLTFAVIGAGPTGIEFAAELRDFVEQDGPKYYPQLLKHVRIKVIEASSTVLAPFDKSLQQEAIRQLERRPTISDPAIMNLLPENFQLTELLLDSSVQEVKEKTIQLNDGREIHYGLAVWAAGNGPLPLTLQLIDAIGTDQADEQSVARGRLAIDPWMRVKGTSGRILAFGDCTCITEKQLPATAQVAAQQGEYLAGLLNKQYNMSPVLEQVAVEEEEEITKTISMLPPPERNPDVPMSISESIANFACQGGAEYAKPFQFLNLGILAYTGGGSALAQVSLAPDTENIKGKGILGNAVWRSVYLSKQVSWRNRLLVLNDWTKRQIFGRDITRL